MTEHKRKARKRRSLTHKEKRLIAETLRESWKFGGSSYDAIYLGRLADEIEQSHVILETSS